MLLVADQALEDLVSSLFLNYGTSHPFYLHDHNYSYIRMYVYIYIFIIYVAIYGHKFNNCMVSNYI